MLLIALLFAFFTPGKDLIWQQSWADASALAAEQNKPVLMVFSGSDWCKPCMRLDQQVFQTEAFKAIASQKLILLKVDFPRKKENLQPYELQVQNAGLSDKYNPEGYLPKVVLVSADGTLLGQVKWNEVPQQFLDQLKQLLK